MLQIIYLFKLCVYLLFLQFRFTINCDLYYVLSGVYNVLRNPPFYEDHFYIYLKMKGPYTATNVVHAHINQLLSSLIPSTVYNLYIYYQANGLNNLIDTPYGFSRPGDPLYISNREYESHQRVFDGRYSPIYIISNFVISRTPEDILYPL